ncbi:MAG: ornithine carbamoyltransferase [Byssovorax sp.]
MKRDLVSLADLGAPGVREILEKSSMFERTRGTIAHPRPLAGLTVALLFDLPSTRTRIALEVAAVELGAHPMVIAGEDSQASRGEPIEDTARVLGRTVALVACRTPKHTRLTALAAACAAPVINALTRKNHPLQVLADLHAVRAARGGVDGLRYAWLGDCTNVARSWIEAAGLLGLDFTIASPPGYGPSPADLPRDDGVVVTDDPRAAATSADVILTDTWVSMGFEESAEARQRALSPYRVTRELLALAAPGVNVLHCLPAHRGEEIDADALDGPGSLVWDAVAARLPTAKAVLAWAAHGLAADRATPA